MKYREFKEELCKAIDELGGKSRVELYENRCYDLYRDLLEYVAEGGYEDISKNDISVYDYKGHGFTVRLEDGRAHVCLYGNKRITVFWMSECLFGNN